MTTLFGALLIFNLAMLLGLLALARANVFDLLAGSAVNPLTTFCLISALFNIDFLLVWNGLEVPFIERVTSLSQATVLDAYSAYTLMFFCMAAGMVVAVSDWTHRVPGIRLHLVRRDDPAEALSARIVFFSVLAIALPVVLWQAASRPEDAILQAYAYENRAISYASFIIAPATALYIAYSARPLTLVTIALLALAMAVLSYAGAARGIVLQILLIVAIVCAISYRRISALWYLPVAPVVMLFLLASAYFFRDKSGRYDSFGQFLSAEGLFNPLFRTEELSFAKVFSVLYEMAPTLDRAPFESIIGLAVYPIPRSFLTWKPLGASTAFTQHVSPWRWEIAKSESLITGYGDLYWQFGLAGACVFAALIGFLWLWLCLKVIHSASETLVFWMPLLIWLGFIFVRNDLFNLGLWLWPMLAIAFAHRMLVTFLRIPARGTS